MARDCFHEFHYEKAIFHIDVNSAFLSWTAVDRLRKDPGALDLRTVPSVIGGDEETRHGIVSAKSIPAKKYGIHTADTVASALRKCPDLIVAKADFKLYREFSHAFLAILRRYTPLVEQASIDEAYMDVTELEKKYGKIPGAPDLSLRGPNVSEKKEAEIPMLPFPLNLAYEIKNKVRDTLGFTVNVGVSSNKLLAKTASDFTKPDRVHTLWPAEIGEKYWPLPIGEMFGCGKATADRLNEIGIKTIGDAAATDEKVLQSFLGEKGGEYIWKSANGIGSTRVRAEQEDAKGYSNETTIEHDITAENFEAEAPLIVWDLAEHVASRLQRDNVYAATVGIIARTDAFRRHTRQKTLPESTNNGKIIYENAMALLRTLAFGTNGKPGLFGAGRGIRLLGVSATKLDAGAYRQMSLFDMMGSTPSNAKPDREKQSGAAEDRTEEKKFERKSRKQIPGKTANDGDNAPAAGANEHDTKADDPKITGTEAVRTEKKKTASSGKEREKAGGQEKAQHLAEMLGRIRSAYGESAVMSGTEFMQKRDGGTEHDTR